MIAITSELIKLGKKYKEIQENGSTKNYKEFAIEIRKTFERLGPTFIKFGQMLSIREDVFPSVFCMELRHLLDKDPEISYDEIKKIVEKELGSKIEEKFEHFEKKPIASASIGQVHKAKLKNGDDVVVKIKKPNIDKIINQDIKAMKIIGDILTIEPKLKNIGIRNWVDEFERWTKDELNFINEAENIKSYTENMKEFEFLKIPKVYEDFSTRNILTMEFIDGISLNDVINGVERKDKNFLKVLKKEKIDLELVIERLSKIILVQTLEKGFFHADPHPANVILLKNNNIGLIDFGIMGNLSDQQRNQLFVLVSAMVENDIQSFMNVALKLCNSDETDNEKMKSKMSKLIMEWNQASMRKMGFVKFLYRFINIMSEEGLEFPIEFILVVKQLATLDGIGLALSPNFSVSSKFKPYMTEFLTEEITNKISEKNALKLINSFLVFMEELPTDLNKMLDVIKQGKAEFVKHEEPVQESNISGLTILAVLSAILLLGLIGASKYKAGLFETNTPVTSITTGLLTIMLISLGTYIILRFKLKSYLKNM